MTRIAPCLVLALLAACASPKEDMARDLKTPLEQHPFQVSRAPDETLLAVHPGGVSPGQADALADAARRWRAIGGDPIVVRAPANAPQDRDAGAMAEQVRAILVAEGVSAWLVRVERYDAAGDPAAPIAVLYDRFVAEVPECGLKWDNLTGTQSNTAPNTFGCSTRANMAAQVANPRDLVQARAEDPAEASRSSVQVGQYRAGQPTASTAPVQGGTVSQAVQ